MANNRFIIDLQQGATAEETANNVLTQLIRLTEQLNVANIPIVKGPNEELPEGIKTGQPIIDYSTGVSVLKTFNGTELV